jgi:hypothetical protein
MIESSDCPPVQVLQEIGTIILGEGASNPGTIERDNLLCTFRMLRQTAPKTRKLRNHLQSKSATWAWIVLRVIRNNGFVEDSYCFLIVVIRRGLSEANMKMEGKK